MAAPGPGSALISMFVVFAWGAASAQTLTYDEQNRLNTATYVDGTEIQYCYDSVGNRTSYSVSTSTIAGCLAVAPIAFPASAAVLENTISNSVALHLYGGASTSVSVSSAATHGTATATGAAITYTPNAGYIGADSFQYTATNSAGTSSAATVSVTVNLQTLYMSSTPGTWSFTVPSGWLSHVVISCAGGGGGGATGYGFLGGAGGQASIDVAASAGSVFSGTIGSPGTNGSSSGTAGGATTCSSSSPAVSMTANGGGGATSTYNGVGGTATGGSTNLPSGGSPNLTNGSVIITQSSS